MFNREKLNNNKKIDVKRQLKKILTRLNSIIYFHYTKKTPATGLYITSMPGYARKFVLFYTSLKASSLTSQIGIIINKQPWSNFAMNIYIKQRVGKLSFHAVVIEQSTRNIQLYQAQFQEPIQKNKIITADTIVLELFIAIKII